MYCSFIFVGSCCSCEYFFFLIMKAQITQEKFYVLNWLFNLFSVLTELPPPAFSAVTMPQMLEGLAAQDGYVVI